MPSSQENNQLSARMAVKHYDHDPDATTAVDVAWVDARDFEHYLFSFFRTIGTSALTMKILANPNSDGSGTDVIVRTITLAAQPDAVGDQVFCECTAQEIAALGSTLRYVSLNLTLATGTDEGVVTYVKSGPRFAYNGLTADIVA